MKIRLTIVWLMCCIMSMCVLTLLCTKTTNPAGTDTPRQNAVPVVERIGDSTRTVQADDSLELRALGYDDGTVDLYLWTHDTFSIIDTTVFGSLGSFWPDTGTFIVRIRAVDNEGLVSESDSFVVVVKPRILTVAMVDAAYRSAFINDTVRIAASSGDSNRIVKYVWSIDSDLFADTTILPTLVWIWPDTGTKTIIVKAVDNKGWESTADTCTIIIQQKIPMVSIMDDRVVFIHDTVTIFAATHSSTAISAYLWSVNHGPYSDTTTDPKIVRVWSDSGIISIKVKAVDSLGLISSADSCTITVSSGTPTVHLNYNSFTYAGDSVSFIAKTTDNDSIVRFLWSVDDTLFRDTTTSGIFKTAWSDTGSKKVYIKIVDADGLFSGIDSGRVFVAYRYPSLILVHDTTIGFRDTLRLTARSADTSHIICKYIWANNNTVFAETTTTGQYTATWADSGKYVLRVKGIDTVGLETPVYQCFVTVLKQGPIITPVPDSMVSISADTDVTVFVKARNANANGSIRQYYWDTGLDGWDDSTTADSCVVHTSIGGTVKVRWMVVDNDSMFSKIDTFVVFFNRPPDSLLVSVWTLFDSTLTTGMFRCKTWVADPDGNTGLTTSVFAGTGANALALVTMDDSTCTDIVQWNAVLTAPVYWRVCVRDSFGDTTVRTGVTSPPPLDAKIISGGSFTMGDSTGDSTALPRHTVTLASFWMDSIEITQKFYTHLMNGINTSVFSSDTLRPMESMTWYDAILFCNKRSIHEGLDTVYSFSGINGVPGNGCANLVGLTTNFSANGYRLPTEAEWEYACRATTSGPYYWGADTAAEYCWYSQNSGASTHIAGTKKPNAFGLYDMNGNVWEWCGDWYGAYTNGSLINPRGPLSGEFAVLRGGSWQAAVQSLNSAARNWYGRGFRSNLFGFRCVRRTW